MQPMQTIKYMGFYIHLGGPSLGACKALVQGDYGLKQTMDFAYKLHTIEFKTLHAAKCAIAKYWRKGLTTEQYKQLKKV